MDTKLSYTRNQVPSALCTKYPFVPFREMSFQNYFYWLLSIHLVINALKNYKKFWFLLQNVIYRLQSPVPWGSIDLSDLSLWQKPDSTMTSKIYRHIKEEAVFIKSLWCISFPLLATKSIGCKMNSAVGEVNCLRGGI